MTTGPSIGQRQTLGSSWASCRVRTILWTFRATALKFKFNPMAKGAGWNVAKGVPISLRCFLARSDDWQYN